MLQINLQTTPAQNVKCILNRQECTIDLFYKYGYMFLNLKVGTKSIVRGAICYPNALIVHKPTNDFSGNLVIQDTLTQDSPTTMDWKQIGTRYFLCYYTEEEATQYLEYLRAPTGSEDK